ncbi:MAG: MBL fold metallo-hydrolase [Sandarakinorhabdus sp.]|nr:MBL fold metallo-hydrolase [Sandarakinorhabdus sp.]
MRPIAVFAAAAAVAIAGAAIAQIGPVEVVPDAVPFRLGEFRVASLRDAGNIAPNDAKVFGIDVGPQAVDAVLAAAGAPTGQISLSVSALLVRMPGHVVLIDTGYGAPRGLMLASLATAGVTPDKVTDILITHGHGDHVGGLMAADGKPVFANAAVRMAAAEWASIKEQPNNAKLVGAITPQVKVFEPGAVVVPGITAVDLSGHTPGHSGYRIASSGKHMLAIGDSAHSFIISLAKPDWAMGYDKDRKLGAERRRALLTSLADSGELVFSPHFPYPGTGHVVRAGDGFTWKPGV